MTYSIQTDILKLQSQLFEFYLKAQEDEVKKYDASWLKDGKTVYRQGGKFASPKSGASAPSVGDVSTVDSSTQLKPFTPSDATVSVLELQKTAEFKEWESKQTELTQELDKAEKANPNFVKEIKQLFTRENLDKMKKDLASLYGEKSQELANAIKNFDLSKTVEDFKKATNPEKVKDGIKGLMFQANEAFNELGRKIAATDPKTLLPIAAALNIGIIVSRTALASAVFSFNLGFLMAGLFDISTDKISKYVKSDRFKKDVETVKKISSDTFQKVKDKATEIQSQIMANEMVKGVIDKTTQGKRIVDKKVKDIQAATESASQKLNSTMQSLRPILDALAAAPKDIADGVKSAASMTDQKAKEIMGNLSKLTTNLSDLNAATLKKLSEQLGALQGLSVAQMSEKMRSSTAEAKAKIIQILSAYYYSLQKPQLATISNVDVVPNRTNA